MIEGQEVMERIHLLSGEGQWTKAVLIQTCMGVVFIHSMCDTIFAMLFLQKPPVEHSGLPGEMPQTTGGLWNTIWETLIYSMH
jgi:hypothetical protein